MSNPTAPPAAYSPAEAAAQLSISRSHVYNMMTAGALTSVKIGRRRIIPRTEIERLLKEGASGPTPRAGDAA